MEVEGRVGVEVSEAKRRRNLSSNADKLLLELVLGSGVNLKVKPDNERKNKCRRKTQKE